MMHVLVFSNVLKPKNASLSFIPYLIVKNNVAMIKSNIEARHLIENFFAKLKQYWAIATRYDKTAQNFLGAIYLAPIIVWLT